MKRRNIPYVWTCPRCGGTIANAQDMRDLLRLKELHRKVCDARDAKPDSAAPQKKESTMAEYAGIIIGIAMGLLTIIVFMRFVIH